MCRATLSNLEREILISQHMPTLSAAPARACVSAAVCESLEAPNCTANPPAVPCSRQDDAEARQGK